jgi:hypothetical protein
VRVTRLALLVLVLLLSLTAACGGSTCGTCQAGSNYCRDPGGGGADLCCPASSPYYCKADNGCHADVFFSCSTGKVFCSSQYNC